MRASEIIVGMLSILFCLALFMSYIIVKKENTDLKAQLADPHHCVSICVDYLEKIAC